MGEELCSIGLPVAVRRTFRGLFLFPLILLHRLRGDGSGRLGAVVLLNVAWCCRDRPPHFAACHSKRYCATRQQCQNDRLDDFVDLLIAHNGLGFVLSALLSECPFLSRPD